MGELKKIKAKIIAVFSGQGAFSSTKPSSAHSPKEKKKETIQSHFNCFLFLNVKLQRLSHVIVC